MPVTPCGNRVRRGWSLSKKRKILDECNATSIAAVCRKYSINETYIYNWRKALCYAGMNVVAVTINGKRIKLTPETTAIIQKLVA